MAAAALVNRLWYGRNHCFETSLTLKMDNLYIFFRWSPDIFVFAWVHIIKLYACLWIPQSIRSLLLTLFDRWKFREVWMILVFDTRHYYFHIFNIFGSRLRWKLTIFKLIEKPLEWLWKKFMKPLKIKITIPPVSLTNALFELFKRV